MLTDLGLATPTEIGKAIDRHQSQVHEYRNRYRKSGVEALETKRPGPRSASKLKGEVLARAQKLLNREKSSREVVRQVGVSEPTIRKGLK